MKTLRTHMRWIMAVIIVAFLLSTFFMYGSGTRGGSLPSGAMQDYVVAEINGTQLKRSALEQRFLLYLEELGSKNAASLDQKLVYQTVLNQYAMEQQMAKEVKERGITISDAEAEQAMKDYADQMFPTREAFYQYLERSGQKPADYKKTISQQMATQRFMLESMGTAEVAENESLEFYDNLKGLFFTQPAGFDVNLIQVSSEGDAEKIRDRILEGKTWGEATSGDAVAFMNVLDVTAAPMFVPESAFSSGYLEPMKSLDIGAVSPVFAIASDDFALGVKEKAVEEKITPYDEVSADIRALLQRQKESETLNNFRQGLLSRAKIVIQDETLFPAQTPEVLPVAEISENTAASGDSAAVSADSSQ